MLYGQVISCYMLNAGTHVTLVLEFPKSTWVTRGDNGEISQDIDAFCSSFY